MYTVEIVIKQNLKKQNSNSYDVSATLPCTTTVVYPESPKDLTSERIGSFVGKSLRSTRKKPFRAF